MPLYEFACARCGAHFEKEIAFHGDQPHVNCPNGHRNVRRIYSAPRVIFKGSGFYSTDHRKANPGKSSE